MIDILLVIGVLVSIALSGFFSGAETGIYCIDRLRLHLRARNGEKQALRLERILDDESSALTVLLAGTNLFNYLTTTLAASLFARHITQVGVNVDVYTTLVVTPVLFVFAEAVPKSLFQQHADTLLGRGSRLWALFDRVFRFIGVVGVLAGLSRGLARLILGRPEPNIILEPKRRMAAMLREALTFRQAGEPLSDVVDRVLRLSETPIHRVMVPRQRVVAVRSDTDREAFLKIAASTRFARLPVYERRTKRVVGIIGIDDLLKCDNWTHVSQKATPAMQLPPHETVGSAIAQAQRAHQRMIIIVDAKDRMLGIATLKDLLEEIVGELPAW